MKEQSRKSHILVVEDDVDERKIITLLLRQANFEVTAVGSFSEAMLHFERGDFDLYLLDQMLDDGSGVLLCRSIRQRDADTPVVFLSGVVNQNIVQAAFDAGASAFLHKPGDVVNLAETIAQLIEAHRERQLANDL